MSDNPIQTLIYFSCPSCGALIKAEKNASSAAEEGHFPGCPAKKAADGKQS